MRVAVTGAGGRLGRALVEALEDAPFTGLAGPIAWTRPDFDLDAPEAIAGLLDRDRPEVVVHAAAWTDVDGCAREPELAMRRNGDAVRRPRPRQRARGIDLRQVSTNEVFDGPPDDGHGYEPRRPARTRSTRTASRSSPASAAPRRTTGATPRLGIVRTAWLYGPPGNDFPSKILAAAERAQASGEPLKVVGDEFGSPTYTHDVAEAIVDLLGAGDVPGVHHVVNGGRRDPRRVGRELLRQAGVDVAIVEVPADDVAAGLDAAALGRPRADAAAGRRAAPDVAGGARRLPADAAPPAGGGAAMSDRASAPAGRPPRADRAPRRQSRLVPRAVARVVVPGADGEETGAAGRDAAAVRPGQPLDVRRGRAPRAPLPPPPARLLDGRVGVGRWSRSSTSGRSRRSDAERAPVETHELAADEWVVIPAGVAHGFLALEPLELLYLVTNEFDNSDELGIRVGRPRGRRPVAADRRDAGRAARSCPTATARTRRSRSWSQASGADRAGPRRTAFPLSAAAPDPTGPLATASGPCPNDPCPPGPSRDCPRLRPPTTLPVPSLGPQQRREPTLAQDPRRHAHRRVRPARAGRADGGRGERRQGRDHRRRGHAAVPRRCQRAVRRGDPAHVERDPGLQPERDVVGGPVGDDRRERRDLPRPRQRLAEPVHLRPELHDEGRLRAELVGERHALQPQVLRRALHPDARPAPGAIVFLHHLCYASGNSEPGCRSRR